ncbi:MAG: GlsB/YeaQ/YmgE family stress response membrane protein [Aridibacter sp.]
MAILSWILFGLAVGIIANFLMPEGNERDLTMTILLGIGGAIVGGIIAIIFGYGINDNGEFGFIVSLLMAIVGAVSLLVLYRVGISNSLTA